MSAWKWLIVVSVCGDMDVECSMEDVDGVRMTQGGNLGVVEFC